MFFFLEMCYDDVFLVWESIWSAKYVCSDSYVAFIALAMIEAYRDILLDNSMDFIDVMKFFNGKILFNLFIFQQPKMMAVGSLTTI